MSVNYVDIGDLSQKSTVAGTEKLPVSDTEYITPAQIGADYLPLSGGTMSGNITMPNNTAIRMQDSGGTARGVAHLGSTNLLQFGYDTAGVGYDTRVSGNSVSLRYGTSRTEGFTLDSSGNLNVTNNKALQWKDSGGTARTVLSLASANKVWVAYGAAGAGYDTAVCGNNVTLVCGTSHTVGLTLDSSGNVAITNGLTVNGNAFRAITVSSSDPTSAQGENGDIWIKI